MKLLLWLAVLSPAIIWTVSYYTLPRWWLENITAYPAIFLICYVILFTFSAIAKDPTLTLTSLCLGIFFFSLTPKNSQTVTACSNDLTYDVIQYNAYYGNANINSFINELIRSPADLVVMQEVSPELGEKLYSIDDIYPFRYGGQEGVGYPSSQLILSRQPLTGLSVFHTPDAQNIISGEWQVTQNHSIHLITAHPPSPRDQSLWYRRNALIRTIESMTTRYPFPDTLIVGDFNLSSKSELFTQLFSDFDTAPVASWPNWFSNFMPPAFVMIAIDHLWLKSNENNWFICSRKALKHVKGSDHLMIRTQIGFKPEQSKLKSKHH
ncbi:endonuclease/exonuclease/phosphatase family protein [Vibrio amylolyticus]|uniref:endonuclease/exonuclease/phosphatase family protein n=1 Tax=Vibrio amylolyticus TaxID=2847292 RepID=UPI003552ADC4